MNQSGATILDNLNVTYRDFDKSEALEQAIRQRASKLEQLHPDIHRCQVTLELPHRHQQKGRHFHVKIEVTIPGKTLVASRDPEQQDDHSDAYIALHRAFEAMERQLSRENDRHNARS